MSCKFIWYNLPKQIKNKLGINDGKGWSNIPKRVNKLLDTLKTDKPTCYSTLFPNGHNILWHNLPNKLESVCELIGCEEPALINFDVEADWEGSAGVSDESSFLDFLEFFQGATNVIISNFNLTAGRLTCSLSCDITTLILGGISVIEINKLEGFNGLTELLLDGNQIVDFNPTIALPSSLTILSLLENQIVDFNPTIALPSSLTTLYLGGNQIVDFNPTIALPSSLTTLYLNGNQIVDFNPTIALPSSLTTLYLNGNQMTISGYTASEPWATAQPTFSNTCNITFTVNIDSVTGTNLETILLTKNVFIIP